MKHLLISLAMLITALSASAHEVTPTILEFEAVSQNQISLTVDTNLEALMVEIGSEHEDTDSSPKAVDYNRLRALDIHEITNQATVFINELPSRITLNSPAGEQIYLSNVSATVVIKPQSDLAIARESKINYLLEVNTLPTQIQAKWPEQLGDAIVRFAVNGEVKGAYWTQAGAISEPFSLLSGDAKEQSLIDYIVIGFEHILPLGLDHILFVLGLYLLSQRLKDLLWQVTAFTAAHTITLALAILGFIQVSPSIVEPLIALSIVYVAVENLFHHRVSATRVVLVFGFGLLHGLGFAGVLTEIGLSTSTFVPSLIAFNVGVELGQLAVITLAFLSVGYWFGNKPYWNKFIRVPTSLLIAMTGAFWVIERTLGI